MSTAIQELISRVERLTGSDREVDARIWWAFDKVLASRVYNNAATGKPQPLPDDFDQLGRGLGRFAVEANSPQFTASVDAALALCERVLPGCSWHMAKGRLSPKEPMYGVELLRENSPEDVLGAAEAETLPVAIILALLHSQSQG